MLLQRVEDADEIVVAGVQHPRGSLLFAQPSTELLQYRLEERARFLHFAVMIQDWLPTSCPEVIAKRIIGAAVDAGVRPCGGIVNVPLFECGRIVATQGYDEQRKVYLDLAAEMDAVPVAPTKAAAATAAEVMLAPFKGYLDDDDPEGSAR